MEEKALKPIQNNIPNTIAPLFLTREPQKMLATAQDY